MAARPDAVCGEICERQARYDYIYFKVKNVIEFSCFMIK